METEVRESHRQEKKSKEIVKCGVRVIVEGGEGAGREAGTEGRGRETQRKYESEKDTQRSLFGGWNLEKREEGQVGGRNGEW